MGGAVTLFGSSVCWGKGWMSEPWVANKYCVVKVN